MKSRKLISLKNECLDEEGWNSIWNKLCHASQNNVNESDLHVDSFWLRLQKEFNHSMRILIVPSTRETTLRMVLDDDKIHFDGVKSIWDQIKKVK